MSLSKEYIKPLAYINLNRLGATLFHLLVEKRQKFDLLLGAGNSGVVLAHITELFYELINQSPPLRLNIPIQRYKKLPEIKENLFDNSILLSDLRKQLSGFHPELDSKLKVLFVDDEIWRGQCSYFASQLILQAISDFKILNLNIVAEDHGYHIPKTNPQLHISFYSFAKLKKGLNNITLYCAIDYEKTIRQALKDQSIGDHNFINILLNEPIKTFNGIGPVFTFQYHQLASERVSILQKVQKKTIIRIKRLLKNGINEYKKGRIKLDFSILPKQYWPEYKQKPDL